MEQDNIFELNKLANKLDNDGNHNSDSQKIERLKKYKIILFLFVLLFLISSIWLYFFRKPAKKIKIVKTKIDSAYTLIKKDSLKSLKSYYLKENLGTNEALLNNEEIIYYVQLGAFKYFKLSKASAFKQYQEDDLNKVTLGTFSKYKNAKKFQEEIIDLGFNDCFLIAKNYGKKVEIDIALKLSREPEYIY